tara:strand:+ start:276 stop:854 length:579 start_codon:yes stop_codon:yes gene_type:complete
MKNFCFVLCISLFAYKSQAFGAEAGMPQLDSKFWTAQIFWLLIIFSSLYIIIWKIFLPKVTLSIENRKSKLVNDIDEAQKLKESAEKKLKEYNQIIDKSKIEAKKIIEDSKKRLDKDIEEKKLKFNEEIEKELTEAENEIKNLKKTSISNINKIAAETSVEVIKQIMNTEVNKSSVTAVVNDLSKKEIDKLL